MNGRMSKKLRRLALGNLQRMARARAREMNEDPSTVMNRQSLKTEARRLRRAYTRGGYEARKGLQEICRTL